jgi:hypothetical protein
MGHLFVPAAVLSQEPLLGTIWVGFLTLAGLGFLVCRRYPWALILMLPLSLSFALPLILELYDPEVGPAIRAESLSYFFQANLAILVSLIAPYWGAIWREEELGRSNP